MVGVVDGQLWHTIREFDGTWQKQFGHIEAVAGNDPGPFTAVGCAASDEPDLGLQVVGVVDGQLWHTIRRQDGSWQDLRGIQGQESNNPGAFTAVSCANDSGFTLHVVGIVGGQLWHTIRHGDGSWQPQYDHVEPVAGNDPGSLSSLGCAAVGGELHVVGTVNGNLWHTIRHDGGA